MKEEVKLTFLGMLKEKIKFKDGFWIYDDCRILTEAEVRAYIRAQGTPILERDITDFLSELSFNNETTLDIDQHFKEEIALKASSGKSKYFASLDKLYPGNKFRELFNYYLFSDKKYSFILIGYGQTGKTTLVTMLSKIIGEGFFGRSNVGMLRNLHGTALLEGKKLFEVAEAQDLDLDTANTLKSIVTNDDIYVNPKFQQQRIVKPHTKMIMTCNNMPKFKVTDDGIIRRFIVVKMNNKIKEQDDTFLERMEKDIPNIIGEALLHPFDIKHWAKEQYYIFESDPQYGFGYGYDASSQKWFGDTQFEKYQSMAKALGYYARNKTNFDKFCELEKIYKERIECDTISKESPVMSGLDLLSPLEEEDVPF